MRGEDCFPAEYIGYQINCPHCNALTLLTAPGRSTASPSAKAPAEPAAAAPVAAVPEVKESFWKRFKGTIELVGALIAIAGVGIGTWQYFKPSEEKLPADEQYALAQQYLDGNGTKKNIKRAGELMKMAAEKVHIKAMAEMGVYSRDGKAGIKKDFGEAFKWFELAGEAGHVDSLVQIGYLYVNGHGDIEKDLKKAMEYFLKAAEQGNAEGQRNVGICFWNIGKSMNPAADTGTIALYDATDMFCVINRGANHGMRTGYEYNVIRGDNVVGKIRITNVGPSGLSSIGEIVKEFTSEQLKAGDKVAKTNSSEKNILYAAAWLMIGKLNGDIGSVEYLHKCYEHLGKERQPLVPQLATQMQKENPKLVKKNP